MKSMTGFGRSVAECENFDLSVDLSSVNKRGLELSVSLPRDWTPFENLIGAKIKKFFTRGKVSAACRANFKRNAANAASDAAVLTELESLRSLAQKAGVEFTPDLQTLIALSQKAVPSDSSGCDGHWAVVEKALDEALEKMDAMRAAEGAALEADISARLEALCGMLADVEKFSSQSAQKYRDALAARLKTLSIEVDLNDERFLKELSIFADRCDVSEEITRLKSHIAQFGETMADPQPMGRKLDFICQEMGREINTVSSKANNIELTKVTIEFKNELERVREQVQNVE